jgi:hypothetical protein
MPWRDFQTRLPTEAEITRWFSGIPMNVAVVTGMVSDVVVIDADSPDGLMWCTRRLPYTPWQTKTARGFHLWYRHPGVLIPNRTRVGSDDNRLAVDVRGDGGYVVAPGSVHQSNAVYEYAGDWTVPRDELPRLSPNWLPKPMRALRHRATSHRPIGKLVERARRYLAAIPPPEIGAGSDTATLSAACRLVRGFALEAFEAEELLWEWAGGRPGWTREWIAHKVAHAKQYGTEPIGALR